MMMKEPTESESNGTACFKSDKFGVSSIPLPLPVVPRYFNILRCVIEVYLAYITPLFLYQATDAIFRRTRYLGE